MEKKNLIFIILLIVWQSAVFAQDYIDPISAYSFNDGLVRDDRGFSELVLRNNASLYNDNERGDVLRFSSADKGHAIFNKQFLDSERLTISFFFYWESAGAGNWHQLFELHNSTTNSNIFFTPQNGWGASESSLISDAKAYSRYKAVSARSMARDQWIHVAITIRDKKVCIYYDGVLEAESYLLCTPDELGSSTLYLGGNPNRSNNFYISARLDEICVFDEALMPNQVLALSNEQDIPAPEGNTPDWNTSAAVTTLEVDVADKKQVIQNFGSSDGWNTERIGKYWPLDKKEKLAELLFSTDEDEDGNLKGIGLSAWRFNIGAGTAEQGTASRITTADRRTECFLNADGSTYNWNKQIGQQWFMKKAVNDYDLHHLIGWQNSPPVAFTKYNLGFREYGESWATILKADRFDDFAVFLADVVEHFDAEGIHFDYISPLNEPQWAWSPSSSGGNVSQEGTPWTNAEIFTAVDEIDKEFTSRSIDSKVFITEAGHISRVLGGTGHADDQLNKFWQSSSSLSLLNKPSFANQVAYHSYFTEYSYNLTQKRTELYQRVAALDPQPLLWQTEYSLLQNGYREGYLSDYKLSEMESALVLSKVILADLNVANVSAWQWWTTFEYGKHNEEARFCLIEALTKDDNSDGLYHANKLLYTLGHFSRFVRPGMQRVGYSRSDNMALQTQYSNTVVSTYVDEARGSFVLVAANYTDEAKKFKISLLNSGGEELADPALYLSNEYINLEKQDVDLSDDTFVVPANSIITYTADLGEGNVVLEDKLSAGFSAYFNSGTKEIIGELEEDCEESRMVLYDLRGKLLRAIDVADGQREFRLGAADLCTGVYLLSGESGSSVETEKLFVY